MSKSIVFPVSLVIVLACHSGCYRFVDENREMSQPSSLDYVLVTARRYGDARVIYPDRHDELVQTLDHDDYCNLAATYQTIVDRNDAWRISEHAFHHRYPTRDESRQVIYLLHLFQLLHERDVSPFAEKLVRFDRTVPDADPTYGFVPDELQYLVEVVSAFKEIETIDDVYEVVSSPTPEQVEMVRRYGERVVADSERIRRLYEDFPSTRYPKVRKIFYAEAAISEMLAK